MNDLSVLDTQSVAQIARRAEMARSVSRRRHDRQRRQRSRRRAFAALTALIAATLLAGLPQAFEPQVDAAHATSNGGVQADPPASVAGGGAQAGAELIRTADVESSDPQTTLALSLPYGDLIVAAADSYGLDPLLLAALVRQESRFDPMAVSQVGALGLTQLMPATAQTVGVSDATDPEQALNGGALYLASQLARFGSVRLALAAYNAGPGAVARYGTVPPFAETQAYVRAILGFRAGWRQQAARRAKLRRAHR
jgi:soluble lytic murein transglycosylase-like protein